MMVGLPDPQKSRVILVGVPHYAELDDLPAVENNIRRLRDLLMNPDLWGLPAENCTIIVGDDDPRTVPREIRAAAKSVEGLLLIYYAGHGLLPPDSDRFCLALPSSSKDHTDSALPYEYVRTAVSDANPIAGRMVILDCCFSARAFEGGMAAPLNFGELTQIPGTCMLTSSDATTRALAPPGETYTAFTGELISAIENGLDDAPEFLDASILYRHLCAALAMKSRPQPQFFSKGEGRALCFVRNRRYAPPKHASPPSAASDWLPGGISVLVHAQVRAAYDFPYRLVGARQNSLSAVYVRQDVTESRPDRERPETATAPDSDPAVRDSRPTQILAVPRTVDEALRFHRHLVITGGPGHGKSTLTLQITAQLAHDLLRQTNSGEPPLIPIRVTATSLAARKGPLFRRIGETAAAELEMNLDSDLPKELFQRVPGQRTWLIVIDGLDEITDPERRSSLIAQLAARTRDEDADLRLLITTRPLEDAELVSFRGSTVGHYQLEPFSRERLHDFACRWFSEGEHETSQAADFLHQIQQAGPSELVRVPLLATIAAIVYEQHPATALPGSKYVLYQSYLSYLQAARSEATSEQWRRIRNRIRNIPGGDTRPLDYLRDHLPQLVSHLAEAAVGGGADLGQIALGWIELHSGHSPSPAPLLDWAALVAGLLDSTGLFVHTASGQRFIHHSFAEHLAGQAVSNRLPPDFDPTNPGYTKVIGKAAQGDQTAIAALVHHSYYHPIADQLLEWLGKERSDHWLLTGDLLAEGIKTFKYEHYVMLFLGAYSKQSGSNFEYVSSPRDFWDIVACLHGTRALGFLEKIASDPRCHAEQRIQAAKALPPIASTSAAAAFRAIFAAADASFASRCEAAAALAELDPAHTGEAASALRAVIRDAGSSNSDRSNAARVLGDLGSGYIEEAAVALGQVITSAEASPDDRSNAARVLGDLGSGYIEEAAVALGQVTTSAGAGPSDRAGAARALGDLGPGYIEKAATTLREIMASAHNSLSDRASAADDLGDLGPGYAEEAAATLREIMSSAQAGPSDRTEAAGWLANLGPRYTKEAAAALREVAASAQASLSDRADAAKALGDLEPSYAEEAANALRQIIGVLDDDQLNWTLAGRWFEVSQPGDADEGAEILRKVIAGRDNASVRRSAAKWLAELGPSYADEGIHLIRRIITSPEISILARSDAVDDLAALGDEYADEGAEALRGFMNSPQASHYERANAARWLGNLGPLYSEEAAAFLREIISSPDVDISDCAIAASRLGEFGPNYAGEAAAFLRKMIYLPSASAISRSVAGVCLAHLGPALFNEAAQVIKSIATSPENSPSDRCCAAALFAENAAFAKDAIRLIRDITAEVGKGRFDRILSAVLLSEAGREPAIEARQILQDVASARESNASERSNAMKLLAGI